ncbi:LADA_0G03158g1_1 [Lachancea dasiensis]|uniref:LADA_0G03158g1_1 n=1 Tax=Lachancea dasiensis TaxID=1072105 RepID=A0A1G4JRT7_9SACH|nr:LADA_0G03158g1_1 [Lachancea dasiensis]
MPNVGLTITTKNAIITSQKTLLLKHAKFFPPHNMINECAHDEVIRMCYRRFMRIKPLVSQRQMIQTTYVQYLRYKFRTEDYEEKLKASGITLPKTSFDDSSQVYRSLLFCLKAVSTVKKGFSGEKDASAEIRRARNILKNILTVEFEKSALIAKNSGQNFTVLRKSFSYLRPSVENAANVSQFAPLRDFDRCLLALNITLGTRL